MKYKLEKKNVERERKTDEMNEMRKTLPTGCATDLDTFEPVV